MTNANDLHETKTHGQLSFPYAVYKSDIPRDMRSFPLHWHDDAEIIYIESGSGVITVQSHEQKVGRGDIITVPPQSVHAIESERGMRYFNVLFNFSLLDNSANDVCYEKYLKPLYCQTELPPIFAERKSEYYKQLLPHVAYLIDNRHKIQTDELKIKSELFAIIDVLHRFAVPTAAAEISLKNNYDKLKILLDYIKSEYADELSVEAAAAMCSYSPSHFMKLFKDLTGKSFTRYVVDYRLEIAAQKLAEPAVGVTEAAATVGFNNMSYFTRAFSAKYGVIPSEYKKRLSQ